jgi:ketosteroid isomerase-like protein
MNKIQDFFTIYEQSAWAKDTKSMIELYHDDVLIFDMWQQGFQRGLSEWSAVIKDWLGSLNEERVRVTFEMIEINEHDTVGFASAIIKFQAIAPNDSVIRSMKNRITLGFIKKGNVWKAIHQHTSAPLNNNLAGILNF